MKIEEAQTEQVIKQKAKELFFKKGLIKTTTQEIADAAGVNRALIHYYFRSREHMLSILLDEAMAEKRERVKSILSFDLPFREKIARYIDAIITYNMTYPYLENFIISETVRNKDRTEAYCARNQSRSSDLIRDQLAEEIQQGRLAPITPEHFLVNLIALCNYPMLAKPILRTIHGMTEEAYHEFLLERKQVIYMTIFNEEMPSVSE
ncbi:MAG: TetR/AcrR family transcriptional regulator [Imperialibacter sp.]|uniref:TetR/AcrR family transcriptional regulator n=1 Tax=Imperialibacter sp. TaxID=2038411 RepID=UPI0032EBD409